ncbi:helix-turn-helix domain-containing protein [Jannaschia ovalis]|uniref:Transcriptional regulator n=1 Tax=Jannaschia ovalis TaxID=3038773 RepID=A0ABY8LFK7_9RHOB|nr:transcriptional regulator [Jannaschia sp. GRR-S6-38]WGH78973.1 transcriptional regulator [Jannaschia sp. GRR-S6-38]
MAGLPHLSGEQLRAARCLAGLTVRELAHLSGLAPVIIKGFEATSGRLHDRSGALAALRDALEGEGILFIHESDRTGVAMRRA